MVMLDDEGELKIVFSVPRRSCCQLGRIDIDELLALSKERIGVLPAPASKLRNRTVRTYVRSRWPTFNGVFGIISACSKVNHSIVCLIPGGFV